MPDLDAAVDHIEDDVLRLMFLTCHPVLPPESRAALTLRLVGGLTTQEIARGFLVKDATMGQRISRAKKALVGRRLRAARRPGASAAARRRDVGDLPGLQRGLLRDRRRRLDAARPLPRGAAPGADARPSSPRPSRRCTGCRRCSSCRRRGCAPAPGRDGEPVLLEAQDRRLWDQLLIRRGFAALDRAEALGKPVGPYVLQAALAACHARARRAEDTDWVRIAGLYDVLAELAPSPVVEVNRAVAHGRAFGADAGLAVLDGDRRRRCCPSRTCCSASAATCSPGPAAPRRRRRLPGGRRAHPQRERADAAARPGRRALVTTAVEIVGRRSTHG